MLRNNKQREDWLKRELNNKDNVILDEEHAGILVKRIQINDKLFFNEIQVLTEFGYNDEWGYSTVHCYSTDEDGVRIIHFGYPTSESQVIAYLKDHREDEFVKELSV